MLLSGWAGMCKHTAAVLYGVGARVDQSPDLLFVLRSVNHEELIRQAAAATDLAFKAMTTGPELSESDITAVFGIELDNQKVPPSQVPAPHPNSSADSNGSEDAKPMRSARARRELKAKNRKKKLSSQARAHCGCSEGPMGQADARSVRISPWNPPVGAAGRLPRPPVSSECVGDTPRPKRIQSSWQA